MKDKLYLVFWCQINYTKKELRKKWVCVMAPCIKEARVKGARLIFGVAFRVNKVSVVPATEPLYERTYLDKPNTTVDAFDTSLVPENFEKNSQDIKNRDLFYI